MNSGSEELANPVKMNPCSVGQILFDEPVSSIIPPAAAAIDRLALGVSQIRSPALFGSVNY